MNTNKMLWLVLGILFSALIAVAVYKAWPLLFPKAAVTLMLDAECDLRAGPCSSPLPEGGNITLSIKPRSIPVIKPLTLEVDVQGLNAESVEVDLTGLDMYMGFNRVKLKETGKGRFNGEGRIPVCVRDAMRWEAKVMVKTSRELYIAPYRFITVKGEAE